MSVTNHPDRRTMLDLNKTEAEIAKLIAETGKINREARWVNVAAFGGIVATAVAVLAKVFQ